MKSIWKFTKIGLAILVVYGAVSYAFYDIYKTNRIFTEGTVTNALVVRQTGHKSSRRGPDTYYYQLLYNDQTSMGEFNVQLPAGRVIPIILHPDYRRKMLLGSKEQNLYQIYELRIGSKLTTGLLFFALMLFTFGPFFLLFQWIRERIKSARIPQQQ